MERMCQIGSFRIDKRLGVGTSLLFHRLAPSISYTFTITQLAYFLYLIDKLIQVSTNYSNDLAPSPSSRSTMVSPASRWTATPLLILLLSSTTYAQYTLRGRVVQDHHKRALGRRAEPAARPSDSGADESAAGGDSADTSEAGGDDSEDPAGPEASSSTQSDKGDEGDAAPGDGASAGSDEAPAVCPAS
jgi:hypothetical protein